MKRSFNGINLPICQRYKTYSNVVMELVLGKCAWAETHPRDLICILHVDYCSLDGIYSALCGQYELS